MSAKYKSEPKVTIPEGGDKKQGKTIFKYQCSRCHNFDEVRIKKNKNLRKHLTTQLRLLSSTSWARKQVRRTTLATRNP